MPEFILPDRFVPAFNGLIKKQGYAFAKSDNEVIRGTVRWADVVHWEEPFNLQIHTARIAKKENKPLTATFHLHPENFYDTRKSAIQL